jgi:hypothetical protein
MLPVHPTRRMARVALVCLVLLSLAACGGGGGDDGGSGGGDRGGFTLGATTATFGALRNRAQPADVRIPITVTGSAVAAIGAAFIGQTPPPWLFVNIEGTGRNLTLVLRATDTSLNAGRYTSTVTIGSADQAGTVLTTREVQITYDVVIGMVVTATPQNTSFVFGSSLTTTQVNVSVGAPGKSWTITSNQAWLPVPAGVQQGDANLALTLNGAGTGQAPGGTAVAQLIVQNTAEPIDRHVLTINAAIVPPLPIVSVTPVVLGGTTGLRPLSQQLNVSLDTGTNVHPWTLTLDTSQSPGWVASDVSAGNVSAVQHATVTLSAGSSIGAPGNYSGTAHFDVTVQNQTFRTSVPITLKWHGQRLVPEYAGIAFSSFPSGLRPATRTLSIRGSRGVSNVPWTAVSDQSWLSATQTGVTGGNLVLVANPAGLAADQLHLAQVTLSSTSAGIERNETVRVGLWIGSTNPVNVDLSPLPSFPFAFAVNPVEPYAYVLYDGEVHVYNVYSGTEIDVFSGGFEHSDGGTTFPTSMDVSSDGSTLYVANGLTARVLAVNAATGNLLATWQSTNGFGIPSDSQLRYTRTNGYPVLWTPFGDQSTVVIDLEAGAPVQLTRTGFQLFQKFEPLRVLTPDGGRMFTIDSGSTTTSLSQFTTDFGVLGGRTLEINLANGSSTGTGGFVRELCISASGTRLYAHNMGSLQELAIDVEPPQSLREVPRPDPPNTSVQALDCNWNGRVYVGLSTFSAPQNNAFAIDSSGNDLGSFLNGPANSGIIVGQMGLSGDARRVISTHVTPAMPLPAISLHFYDVPP